MSSLSDMLWGHISQIRSDSGIEFANRVLEARSDFLKLRLKQEGQIRGIYTAAAKSIANELKAHKDRMPELQRHLLHSLELFLRVEVDKITAQVTELLKEDMKAAVSLGGQSIKKSFVDAVARAEIGLSLPQIELAYQHVNTAAVEALWARTHKGLMLSDKIWKQSQSARDTMRDIILDGTTRGMDAVRVARDLENYVKLGKRTLAKDYPNMMERMGEGRIPQDLCYEALRLARTEMTNAFREGTHATGKVTPGYSGIRWLLSSMHPVEDVCDDYAEADLYGLGPGGYPAGQEPTTPHPNCLCQSAPIMEDPDVLTDRILEWMDDPGSQPDIEEWYGTMYGQAPGVEELISDDELQARQLLSGRQFSDKFLGVNGARDILDAVGPSFGGPAGQYGERCSLIDIPSRFAVDAYSSNGYIYYNCFLRARTDKEREECGLSESGLDYLNTLVDLTNRYTLGEDTVLIRGISPEYLGTSFFEELDFPQTLMEPGFFSTSFRENIAEGFVGERDGILLKIKAPKETPGVFVDIIRGYAWESEFLIAPGAKIVLTNKYTNKKGIRTVEGVIIND